MVSKKTVHETEFKDNLKDGKGMAILKNLLPIKPINVTLFSEVDLDAGCSIGRHSHEDESKIYYILEGSGVYDDNGKEVRVEKGDVTVCHSGESHALENDGGETLKILAIIVME